MDWLRRLLHSNVHWLRTHNNRFQITRTFGLNRAERKWFLGWSMVVLGLSMWSIPLSLLTLGGLLVLDAVYSKK